MPRYPKLVRDKIPEIIKNSTGKDPVVKILKNDEEYLDALLTKLIEEASEAKDALVKGNLDEELADVLEVVDAILVAKHQTIEAIATIQKEKREKRGGFDKRIMVISD